MHDEVGRMLSRQRHCMCRPCARPASRQQTEQQAAWRAERRRWLAQLAAALAPLRDPVATLHAHLDRIAGGAASSAAAAAAIAGSSGQPSGASLLRYRSHLPGLALRIPESAEPQWVGASAFSQTHSYSSHTVSAIEHHLKSTMQSVSR